MDDLPACSGKRFALHFRANLTYDWAESGDTDMDAYQKDVEIFKSRWFKKARKVRIKEMIDISTEKRKEDLYQAFGFETESSSEP